ncbi:MAG: site-specific integrase [Hyphomicrobiaceae bacterium]
MTSSDDIASFLEMQTVERGASANTVEAYRRDLEHIRDHLLIGGRDLRSARPADLQAYARSLAIDGLAPASRARRLSAVRQLYKFLVAEGRVDEDPSFNLRGPKLSRPLPRTLSVAEVDRLLERAKSRIEATSGRELARRVRLHCLIELLYATGMRVSELVSLPRSALAGDDRVLTIVGKGRRERLVPLNTSARAALDRYLALGLDPEDGVSVMLRSRW